MPATVRQPQQKRSLETKNKILSSAYELFSESGYYNVNTKDIAEHAGVSTGIVYGYFKNKKDILLDVLDLYLKEVFAPILEILSSMRQPIDFGFLISHIIKTTIETHIKNENIHRTLHSLTGTDEDVRARFIDFEDEITLKISDRLVEIGYNSLGVKEKVHFAMNVLQFYAHEYVYDKHDYIDYSLMKKTVNDCLIRIFTE